jgi:hypothetical protein
VPETTNGFRTTIGALRSLDVSDGMSFHTSSLSEDRCMRMTEAEIRDQLEALHINVQALMQLQSKRRYLDPEKDRPLTPHFIVS